LLILFFPKPEGFGLMGIGAIILIVTTNEGLTAGSILANLLVRHKSKDGCEAIENT
jgi:hypothetical protein